MMLGWWLVFGAAMYRVVGDSMEYSFKMQLTEESAKRPECSPVQCQEVGNSRNEVVACLTAAAPLCAYNVKLEMNGYTDEYVADCAELGDRLMTLHLNLSQYGTMNLSRLSGVVRLTLQSPSFSDCYVYSVFSDGSECDSAMAADGMVGFMRTGDTQFEADLGQLTPRGRRVMMGLATNFHVGFCGNGISRLELDRVTYEVTVRTHSRRDEWESTLSGPNATFLYFLPAENSPADCYLAECALGPLSYAQVDACARRVAEYCEMHGQYIINHSQVDGTCEDQKGPGNFTRIAVRLDVLHIFGTTKSVSIAQPPLLRMKTGAARTCRSFLLAVETCPISDDATYVPIETMLVANATSITLQPDLIPTKGAFGLVLDGPLDACGYGILDLNFPEAIVNFSYRRTPSIRTPQPEESSSAALATHLSSLSCLVLFSFATFLDM